MGWDGEPDLRGCGGIAYGYRLIRPNDFDSPHNREKEFRYGNCSRIMSDKLKERGVKLNNFFSLISDY